MASAPLQPDVERSSAAVVPLRLNVGCGSTVAATWANLDNSPTMWLAQRPLLWRLGCALRLVPADRRDTPSWARSVVFADARRHLPFPAGSVDAVYSSHFLEHLSHEEAICFLREVRCRLKPGGIIRTVVPDVAQIVEDYRRQRSAGDEHAADKLLDNLWVIDKVRNRCPAWLRPVKLLLRSDAHKCVYDEASLAALLRDEGFIETRRCGYLESAIPGIEEVEQERRVRGALCLEARKGRA